MNDILVTLMIADQHEESLVDFLLALPQPPQDISFFNGHAIGPDAPLQSAHERVKGRARRTVIQFVVGESRAREIMMQLGTAFSGKRIHYRLMPVLNHGVVS